MKRRVGANPGSDDASAAREQRRNSDDNEGGGIDGGVSSKGEGRCHRSFTACAAASRKAKAATVVVVVVVFVCFILFLVDIGASLFLQRPSRSAGRPFLLGGFLKGGGGGLQHLATPMPRFPAYGTLEYRLACPWAAALFKPPPSGGPSATINNDADAGASQQFLLPCAVQIVAKQSHEGMAEWVDDVVYAYFDALLGGCRLLVGHLPSVDLAQVLAPPVNDTWNDWRIVPLLNKQELQQQQQQREGQLWQCPTGYRCREPKRWESESNVMIESRPSNLRLLNDPNFVHVPRFRHAYKGDAINKLRTDQFTVLAERMQPPGGGGFELQTGMACALNGLWELSPKAAQYQPNLFSEILPLLRHPRTLSVAVYVRTENADRMAMLEQMLNPHNPPSFRDALKGLAEPMRDCVLQLERTYLRDVKPEATRLVWLLISDSVELKRNVIKEYQGTHVGHIHSGRRSGGGRNRRNDTMTRELVTTNAIGTHTRTTRRNVTTKEFAESMIDWYLMGEADVLVTTDAYTFGTMAATRTNIPVHDYEKGCALMKLVER